MRASLLALACLMVSLSPALAQPAAPDTLRLDRLRAAAARHDPRVVQPGLLQRATELRIEALRAQQLPQLALTGQATVQNEVVSVPAGLGASNLGPPREQARVQVEADWTVFDAGRTNRQVEAERARLAEETAHIDVTLYALREATTEAFFSALLTDAQAQVLLLAAADLDARLRRVREQATAGAALAADAAALEAEHLRLVQHADAAAARRTAALGVLADLTGLPIDTSATLALPTLDAQAADALAALRRTDDATDLADRLALGRPELDRLARTAARAGAEADAREAQTRPSVSLFGQAGVGRPSPFDFLSDAADAFALAGVRLRWSLFDGGRARREAAALRVQARIAETEAAAFVRQFTRAVEDEVAELNRLDDALAADARAVALREEVLRVARRQLDEGVLLPDVYADRVTDLAEARLTLAQHRIERAHAQARLLSTLGLYPEARASSDRSAR